MSAPAWLVSNPGSIPELSHFAAWGVKNGLDISYASPIVITQTSDELLRKLPFTTTRAGGRIVNRLARRANPALSGSRNIWRVATGLELGYQGAAAARLSPRTQGSALALRNEVFDRSVAGRVKRVGHLDAGIARSTAALHTLRALTQRGAAAVLDYPIVHHDWLRRIIDVESACFPELAETMEADRRSPRQRKRLDAEIEAADLVLTLSAHHLETFAQEGVPVEKLISIPLGVDAVTFAPPPDDTARDRTELIFVGQITQRKGIGYLLELLETLPEEFHLTLIGGFRGAEAHIMRSGRVRHFPAMARKDLARHYQRAGIFVFPTLAEGFPQTPLEAMSCGLPAVVSKYAYGKGGPVVDGENGFIVDPRNIEQMRDAILRLSADQATWTSMSVEAAKVAENYAWSTFAERLSEHVR